MKLCYLINERYYLGMVLLLCPSVLAVNLDRPIYGGKNILELSVTKKDPEFSHIVASQGDFELENYPIPERYFTAPVEDLFEQWW